MRGPQRSWRFFLVAAVGFGLAAMIRLADSPNPDQILAWNRSATSDSRESLVVDSTGDTERAEVVLIYLGRSACAWCRRPETKLAFTRARQALTGQARERDVKLHVLGVSLDDNVDAGVEHLTRLGGLDEMAVGGGWLNSVGLRYLWGDLAGPAATPQVLVLFRRVHSPGGDMGATYGVANEQLVVRLLGLRELERWVQQGVPVPWGMLKNKQS